MFSYQQDEKQVKPVIEEKVQPQETVVQTLQNFFLKLFDGPDAKIKDESKGLNQYKSDYGALKK